MICQNKDCKKKVPKGRRKYCSIKCGRNGLYETKKKIYKDNAREWEKNNPEKSREQHLKANRKWRENNKERFTELILRNYYKNKGKWDSRQRTNQVLKTKKKPDIDEFCRKCKTKENIRLKYTIYPRKAKEIRQAIKEGKIYYLCNGCRKNERR